MKTCKNCGEDVEEIRILGGMGWMHVDIQLRIADRKKYAWRHCKLSVAEPVGDGS